MKTPKLLLCVLPLALTLINTNCSHKKPDTYSEISSIELLRGDITLCGGTQFGTVNFPFHGDPAVKKDFDLAIALLHSFEYDEAEKAFVKVIDADPSCVMAYWGVAMSNFHPLWEAPNRTQLEKGTKILNIAKSLEQTSREHDYLNAIRAFYGDWENTDHETRAIRFEEKMKAICEKYKDDKEAAIFYALALDASADPKDGTHKNQKEAGAILEALFVDQPNHPGIAHYIIHSYDYPELAGLALPTARRYASIAPASAHAQHMPSHIFTRLGLWEESIKSNLNSTSSALCYEESTNIKGHWDEELHGMDYLVYAYLQLGDNRHAEEQLDYLNSFDKTFPENFKVAYASAAIPARIALENRNWKRAADIQAPPFAFPWDDFPWQKAIIHYTRAMGSARLGNIDAAEKELSILQSLHKKLADDKDDYKSNQVNIQIKTIEAWIQYARGDYGNATGLMKEAASMEDKTAKHPVTPGEVLPARELLGDLYLLTDAPAKALEVYEMDLKKNPNRFNALYGAAVAAKQTGNLEMAAQYFRKLLAQTKSTESDRQELVEAKAFLKPKIS